MKSFKEYLILEEPNIKKSTNDNLRMAFYFSVKNAAHGCRIKVNCDYSEEFDKHNYFVVTVPEGVIIGKTEKIKERDINYFKEFVKINKDTLIKYWKKEITEIEAKKKFIYEW